MSFIAIPAAAPASAAGDATGSQVTLSQQFGSITANTLTGSLSDLVLRNPDGSLPAQSLTGGNPITTSVTDSTGQQYDSALGTPADVTVGRDQQTGAVTSIHLDGIPLNPSPLAESVSVGQKPNSVAFSADGETAYVTNFSSGSVSPVPTTVVPYDGSPVADWIWNTPGSSAPSSAIPGTIYLRKTFSTPPGVTRASLRINADDAEVTYVNGVQVASSTSPNWPISQYVDITADLNPAGQQNVIAVAATNGGASPSPAGVIAALQVDGSSPQRLVTDTSWKAWPASTDDPPVSATPPASDWNTVAYDDSAWEDSFSAGAYGISPWHTISNTVAPISVGGNPSGIVVTPNGELLVANYSKNQLQEVDPSSRRIVNTVPVGISPEWPAITPDGKTVLVPNAGSNSVTAVDIANGTVEATIPVGGSPTDVVIPKGAGRAYVTNLSSGKVVPIDLSTRAALPAWPAGAFPNGNAISPDGQQLLVADYSGSTVSRYRLGQLPPPPVTEDWALSTTNNGRTLHWTITQHWHRDFRGTADADPSIPFATGITSTVWYDPTKIYSPSPDVPPFASAQTGDRSQTLDSTGDGPASGGVQPADTWAVYKLWSRFHLAADLRLGVSGGYLTRYASQYGYTSDAGGSFEPGKPFTVPSGTTRSMTLTVAAPDKFTTGYQLDASIPDTNTLGSLRDFYQSLFNGGTVAGQSKYLFGNEVSGYLTGYAALPTGTALNVGIPSASAASNDNYSLDAAYRNYLVTLLDTVQSDGGLYFGLGGNHNYRDNALWTLLGLYQYTLHTGDLALFRNYEATIARMLAYWTNRIQGNGLVMSRNTDGNYYDAISFGTTYYSTSVNAFVYEALQDMGDLEHALAEQDAAAGRAAQAEQERTTASGYVGAADGIKSALNSVMWTPGSPHGPMYADWVDNDNGERVYSFTDDAQYPAIVFGIADHSQATQILSTADGRLAQLPSVDGYSGMGTPNVLWPLPAFANSHNYAFGQYMNGGMFLFWTYYEVMARAITGDAAGAYARLSGFARGFAQNSWYGTNWAEPSGVVVNSNGNEPYLADMLLTASALTQGILGVHESWDSLSVTPALPSGWHSARTGIIYRGAPYCVTITDGTPTTAHGPC